MRLGVVAPGYGVSAAGEPKARARVLAESLAARGHGVTVLTLAAQEPGGGVGSLPAAGSALPDVVPFRTRKALVRRLREPHRFEALLFFGPDDPATREGLAAARGRGALVPTGDPERGPEAAFDRAPFDLAATVLFASPEEQALVAARRGAPCGEVVGYGLALEEPLLPPRTEPPASPAAFPGSYVLHAGPLEARDGCAVIVEQFLRFQRARRSSLSLVLLGRGRVELHECAHVRHLGELGVAERRRVIAGARAVLVPSRREALSPLLLEAWSEARPAVVSGSSGVLRGTVERTGGGLACAGFDELSAVLDLLEQDAALASALGAAGRRALEAEHALGAVLDRCERALRALVARRPAA